MRRPYAGPRGRSSWPARDLLRARTGPAGSMSRGWDDRRHGRPDGDPQRPRGGPRARRRGPRARRRRLAERVALDGHVWGPWLVAVDAASEWPRSSPACRLAGTAGSRVGPALVAIGGLWFLGAFGYGPDPDLIDFVGFPLQGWHDVLLIVLLLAITPGGLREPAARGSPSARSPPSPSWRWRGCCCGRRSTTRAASASQPHHGRHRPAAYEAAVRIASFAEAALAVAALALVAVRWRRASGPARRTLAPLLVAGVATAVLITYNRVATRVLSAPVQPSDGMLVAMAALRITIAAAIVVSLMRGRRARTRVADVVTSLDAGGPDSGSAAMRRALADPRLQLLRWSPERHAHRRRRRP